MSRRFELSRRHLIQGSAIVASGLSVFGGSRWAAGEPSPGSNASPGSDLVAQPPAGFLPLSLPGRVAKVAAKGDFPSMMQKNELWPRPEVARRLLERALMDLTGAPSLVGAMQCFVHPRDVVAVKVNGISGQKGHTMAVNFEVILPLIEAIIAAGVPPERITVYEQTTDFLRGTRVNVEDWRLPEGVRTDAHGGIKVKMRPIKVYGGVETAYVAPFTQATAVIDMTMVKHHSVCGYTGTLKNVTFGSITKPHELHAHLASPQIAVLYNHPIVTSRVRLHVTDAFKIMPDKGPLDRDPKMRVPHGAIYAATDPVAMDTIGWKLVDDERKARGIKTLSDAGREPRYIRNAAEFGLGIHDLNRIRMTSVEV
ncbi:MAG: DUF362 domain-containing protein [Polyangiaceae bacterium]|nr:DUF362 domain-containing protein [Polyangiaceae bacterium]